MAGLANLLPAASGGSLLAAVIRNTKIGNMSEVRVVSELTAFHTAKLCSKASLGEVETQM